MGSANAALSICAVLQQACANAVQVLLSKGVDEGKILFLSLIAAPEGIHRICAGFPRVKVITSEIDEGIGPDFQVVPGKQAPDGIQHNCMACTCSKPEPSFTHHGLLWYT